MKKLISFLTALIIFLMPFSYIQANETTGFLEALSNTYKLESYKVLQSIYGDFKVDEYGDKVDGNFRLSFSGNVNSDAAYENNSSLRLNGYIKINHREGTYKSFDELMLNITGEVASIFGDGIYVRLSDIKINGTGIDPSDREDMNAFLAGINEFKNQWYRIPMDNLMNSANAELTYELGVEEVDYNALIEEMQEMGFMEAIKEQVEYAITSFVSSAMPPTEDDLVEKAIAIVDKMFKTNFFNQRDIISGRNIGFKFFTFNKASVINLVQYIADIFDEDLNDEDISELRRELSKFNFAGIYRINSEHNLIDNLLIKLTLRNIQGLDEMHLKYRYKISNFNSAPQIGAPTDYLDIAETGTYIPYINDPYDDFNY